MTSATATLIPSPTLSPRRGMTVRQLGILEYNEALDLQRQLVDDRVRGLIADTLLLLEHPHVVTRGAGHNGRTLGNNPHPLYDVDRGGDITYHGPGQLVGYPIVHLKGRDLTIGAHLRTIEAALIRSLADFGIKGERLKGFTGVWVGGRKIASIGIAVRAWVAYHGFALNVATDLSQFNGIHPCGLEPGQMTSMERVLGSPPLAKAVRAGVAAAFAEFYRVPDSREHAQV